MTRIKQEHNHDPAQGILFNPTRAVAHRNAPETSHAAARSVNLPRTCARVIELLKRYGSMTDEALNARAKEEGDILHNTGLAPARCMLCPPRGVGVVDSGKRRVNESGREAVVWMLDGSPGVLPSQIRKLRQTQRDVLDVFEDAVKLGIDRMSHGQLCHYYREAAGREGLEQVQSEASVRSRCAELVDLHLVKRYPDSNTEKGKIAMWGLA